MYTGGLLPALPLISTTGFNVFNISAAYWIEYAGSLDDSHFGCEVVPELSALYQRLVVNVDNELIHRTDEQKMAELYICII